MSNFFKKKSNIVLVSVAAVVLILALFLALSYNNLVGQEEAVKKQSSNITAELKRRAELIPDFVATVEGYSDYEQSTYIAVVEARSAVNEAKTPEEVIDANDQLNKAVNDWVSAINVVVEAYPDLDAIEQYNALLDELAGTANRIKTAIRDYNESAEEYNSSIRKFPKNLVAGMFGFEQVEYFEADESEIQKPQVNFNK